MSLSSSNSSRPSPSPAPSSLLRLDLTSLSNWARTGTWLTTLIATFILDLIRPVNDTCGAVCELESIEDEFASAFAERSGYVQREEMPVSVQFCGADETKKEKRKAKKLRRKLRKEAKAVEEKEREMRQKEEEERMKAWILVVGEEERGKEGAWTQVKSKKKNKKGRKRTSAAEEGVETPSSSSPSVSVPEEASVSSLCPPPPPPPCPVLRSPSPVLLSRSLRQRRHSTSDLPTPRIHWQRGTQSVVDPKEFERTFGVPWGVEMEKLNES